MDMLQITFHEGVGLAGGFFGTKDPYIVATMGAQKVHTNVVKNGGKNPKWEQTFTIPYEGEEALHIQVFDKDTMGKDDVMGEGRMDLVPLRSQRRWTTNVPIDKKKNAAGNIRVSVYLKEGRPVHNGSPSAVQQPVYQQPIAVPAPAPVYQQMPSYPGAGYHQPPAPGYGPPPFGHAYPPGPPPGHYHHPMPQGQYPPQPGYGGPGYPGQYPPY